MIQMRDANGRFVRKTRLVVDGVPQTPIDVEKAVANYAQAAMNAPEGPAKQYWTNKLWNTRNAYGYVTKLS
jgi:hypothetical protein